MAKRGEYKKPLGFVEIKFKHGRGWGNISDTLRKCLLYVLANSESDKINK